MSVGKIFVALIPSVFALAGLFLAIYAKRIGSSWYKSRLETGTRLRFPKTEQGHQLATLIVGIYFVLLNGSMAALTLIDSGE